jgi:hypothetical protein
MKLDELKARIEAEALRRQAARDGFTLDAVRSYLGQDAALPAELRREPPPAPQPLKYEWFDQLAGRALVNACYASLLGRGADPAGMEYYLGLLDRGASKARVVGAIAYSGEARKRGVRVGGLAPRFALAMLEGMRVVGPLVGWVAALSTLNAQRRRLRAMENRLEARLEAVAHYVGQSSAQVGVRIEALRSVLEAKD